MNTDVQKFFQELLEAGYAYRYTPERFAALEGKGHPYPSPTRTVTTPVGAVIEELIQPVLQPIVFTLAEEEQLRMIARNWPAFLRAQLSIFRAAKSGELDLETTAIVRQTCTDEEWASGLTDPGYGVVQPFVRLDAIRTPDGFKVIDINTTRPAGVGDVIVYHDVMRPDLPAGCATFPIDQVFATVVLRCVDEWASGRRLPGESVPVQVLVRPDDGDWRNFERLTTALKRHSGMCYRFSIVSPEEFEGVASKGSAAVVRSRIKEGDPFYDVLKDGYPLRRCVLSPLYRRFLGNKLWMYLLRAEPTKAIFESALGGLYESFADAFPDVGVVGADGEVDFGSRVSSLSDLSRREWVLKDPSSSSGRRMVLGYTVGTAKWRELLWVVQPGWIAQRFYAVTERLRVAGSNGEPVEQNLFTKYGVFIFGGELAGSEFMARSFPLVHGARNTYMNTVLRTKTNS